jgi:hypothetical protein
VDIFGGLLTLVLCGDWRAEAEFMNVQFLILRALKLKVSGYNVYITNQFQATFSQGGGGGNKLLILSQLRLRIRPLGQSHISDLLTVHTGGKSIK